MKGVRSIWVYNGPTKPHRDSKCIDWDLKTSKSLDEFIERQSRFELGTWHKTYDFYYVYVSVDTQNKGQDSEW